MGTREFAINRTPDVHQLAELARVAQILPYNKTFALFWSRWSHGAAAAEHPLRGLTNSLALRSPPSIHSSDSNARSRRLRVTSIAIDAAPVAATESAPGKVDKVALACPVCFEPFSYGEDIIPIAKEVPCFTCSCCRKTYSNSSRGIIDLTIPSTTVPIGTSLFQNPLLAFAYDRGYRDFFRIWNFPGFDEEFRMAQKIMEPARGEIIMDLSCGGGSFTRRFLASNTYKLVVAADYSESMLEQCRGFLENDKAVDIRNAVLVRADAARLPFAKSSLAAVHSGAAIHCWPQPTTAVAEIARVLRPGGVFVASTFFFPQPPSPLEGLVNPVRQAIMELQLPFKAWTEKEIQQIVEASGLVGWKSKTIGRYILFSAMKSL